MDRINVAHIIYGLKCGGAETLLLPLTTRLDLTRFRAIVLALTCGGPIENELRKRGVDVRILGKKNAVDFTILFKLIDVLKEEKIQIVHTHLFSADLWGRTAARLAGVPVVVSTFHGSKVRVAEFLKDRLTDHFMDRIIGLYEAARPLINKKLGFKNEKIVIIPNGVDVERFSSVAIDVGKKREEFGISARAFVAGNVGRLVPMKGQEYFIRAIARACRENGSIVGVIVGSGELEDKLKQLSRRLSIAGSCYFLGERRDMPEIMHSLDVMVLSSVQGEALSMALLEAMASGKAVIATRTGAAPEIISHGRNGFLVEPEDADEIAALLVRLSNNREELCAIGEEARATIRERYSEAEMMSSLEELYVTLLAQRQGKR